MPITEEMGLDSYQQAAVAHGDGPAIVLAGPGSGKTSVMVERAVRLIDEGAARPDELLVLTFSRKAAGDLRERLAARLQRSYASFPVTTFHAFCFGLLDRPRLATQAERDSAIRAALGAEDDLGYAPSSALAAEALSFCSLCDEYLTVPDNPLARVRAGYLEALPALDYGGLQREAVALLEREPLAEPPRFVLVDEYQDTNVAQERLLELVAGESGNVFCVADEDQSIYGFRGAEIENTLGFERRWPGARTYELPTNYRSAPRIVEAAASVIRLNVDTHRSKTLRPAADRPAELTGKTFSHAAEEADWIAREIAALRLEGTELGKIAILARSLRQVGPRLAYALRRHGIPFHSPLAPPLHPTSRALAALIELALPERWDEAQAELALDTLASPLFGADPLALRRFRRGGGTVYGDLRRSREFEPFFTALGIVRRQRTAGDAVYTLWQRLPYFRELQERIRRDGLQDDVDEVAAVTALSDAANAWEGALADFPSARGSGALSPADELPPDALPPDAVAQLTVHAAKGLEWDAVFVCDLVEGRFPALSRAEHTLFRRDEFAPRPLDEAGRARRALEEERRLFYVAITRARTRVNLTATEEAREERGRSLSRFYGELERFLEPVDGRIELASAEEALVALRRAGGGPPGWRALAPTRNERPMLPEGGLYTSASGLDPYENCPLQFFYGTLVELVRPTGPQLVFGGILHDTLEEFHRPEGPADRSLDRLLRVGEGQWRPGVIRPAALEHSRRARLERMLRDYHRCEIEGGEDGEVLAVERYFRFGLDASTVSGRIDRIDRLRDGLLRLVDYKSGKAMGNKDAAEDLQLALYALACLEVPELAALGRVGRIEYVHPGHVAGGKIGKRGQDATPELAGATRERVRGLVAQIAGERFAFSPEAECKFCDFQTICPRHVKDVPV